MVPEPSSYNVYDRDCPSRTVLDLIANKWTVLVIGQLQDGTKRFSILKRGIDGISQKMLTQTLRDLEKNGLVQRTIYAEVPPRVEYQLTALGMKLIQPLNALCDWAETYIDAIHAANAAYNDRQ